MDWDDENVEYYRRRRNIVAYVASITVRESAAESSHNVAHNPMLRVRNSMLTGRFYTQELLDGAESRFREVCGLDKDVFLSLCDLLKSRDLLQDTRRMSVEEIVMIFLFIIVGKESNRRAQERFQHSGETISRKVNTVIDALTSLLHEYIKLPPMDTPAYILERRKYRFFEDCIGAIDGTHFLVEVSAEDVSHYRDRKGHVSQNVMAACNFDMKFLYVHAGYEGGAPDSIVLRGALERGFHVPEGKYYLVDAGYPNTGSFLAPYRNVRYHLKEYGANRLRPQNYKELFNLRHASLRNVIERMFGVLKERFHIFQSPIEYRSQTQTKIILVGCLLHNYIRDIKGGVDDLYRYYDRQIAREMEDDIINRRQERLEMHVDFSTSEDRRRGKELRNGIAREMWEEYISRRH